MFSSTRNREFRSCSTRQLQRRVSAESDLVQRLERQRVLDGHHGCVNTAVGVCQVLGIRVFW